MQEYSWARGWIAAVAEAGLFVGDQEGNFNPGGTLNMDEWITVLIRILGYEEEGMSWPDDYSSLVEDLGLTDGIEYEGKAPVIRAEMAQFSATAADSVPTAGGEMLNDIVFGQADAIEVD